MKKIATVTIYDRYNFGNRLQAYALQRFLNDYCEYESKELVLKDNLAYKIKNIFKYVLDYKGYRKKTKKKQFYRDFDSNISLDYRTRKQLYNGNVEKQYDSFLVGSDQVWNPYFGANNLYFLDFVKDKKKKNSYAASIGVTEISKEKQAVFENKLKSFSKISVRENEAKDILEKKCNIHNVEVLIDPTLLLSSAEWRKIEKKPQMYDNKKIILLYFLGNIDSKVKKDIQEFGKKNNLEIINILDNSSKYYNIGPSEFIFLIDHAELVCTDSFHASVFSLIFDKSFIIFDREDKNKSMNSRIKTLVQKFDLKDREYRGTIIDEYIDHNYENAYNVLKSELKKCEEYLNNI